MQIPTFVALLPALVGALPTTPSIIHDVAKNIIARAPPEAGAVLKSASASGTGCAANSASFVFGVGDGATVGFDNMIVDGTLVDKTKRCVISLDLQLDSKWKYTINKATNVRGYAEKEGGSYKVAYTVGGKMVWSLASLNPLRIPSRRISWRIWLTRMSSRK